MLSGLVLLITLTSLSCLYAIEADLQNRAKRTPRLNHGVAVDCLCPPRFRVVESYPYPRRWWEVETWGVTRPWNWATMKGIGALLKVTRELTPLLPHEDTAQRWPSPDTDSAADSILDFQPPETWDQNTVVNAAGPWCFCYSSPNGLR